MKYIKYKHHGIDVSVREDLKGKHREHCLCWSCARFMPIPGGGREVNCPIANLLFAVDVQCNITTPVWECKKFVEKS